MRTNVIIYTYRLIFLIQKFKSKEVKRERIDLVKTLNTPLHAPPLIIIIIGIIDFSTSCQQGTTGSP